MDAGEVRYYKGIVPCIVLIVGKGKIGNVMVELLKPYQNWKEGDKIVTRPRLLWKKPKTK